MISLGRSHGLVRAALTLLPLVPAAPVGAQVAPYKIAEAELPIVPLWAKVKHRNPVVVARGTVSDLRIVVREASRTLSLDEAREFLGVKGFQVRAEMSGPGLPGPLELPRAGDEAPQDPLVLRLPPLASTGDYTVSGLRLVARGKTLLEVAPRRLTVRVVEEVPVEMPPDDEDTTPPSTIDDLSASLPRPGVVRLTWTAPDDESPSGAAAGYEVLYSTQEDFSFANKRRPGPQPARGGTVQTFDLRGLRTNTTYYLALRAADDVHNLSETSNVISVTVR